MPVKIKADVLQALDDWKAGKPVKSIELGHTHRMKENGGQSPTIDLSVRLANDQERAYAYCFAIIDYEKSAIAESFEEFLLHCEVRRGFTDVTHEEAMAAESLAWKALHVGWRRAIDGHRDSAYIEVSRQQVQST